MSAKLATPGLLKMKIFQNKGYGAINPGYSVSKKILWRDSNYIADVVMWPNFSNSSIFKRKVIITSVLYGFHQENPFFWGVVLVQVQ